MRKLWLDTSGFVYLISSVDGKYWKIGRSKTPDTRIGILNGMMPFKVYCVHLIDCYDTVHAELVIHNNLYDKRLNGEWFRLTERDVRWIKSIKDQDDLYHWQFGKYRHKDIVKRYAGRVI